MIFLSAMSIRSKRLASSGSCSRMSSDPTKMASRYIHLDWTFVHTSITSEMFDIWRSHFCVSSRKGATKRDDIIEDKFII